MQRRSQHRALEKARLALLWCVALGCSGCLTAHAPTASAAADKEVDDSDKSKLEDAKQPASATKSTKREEHDDVEAVENKENQAVRLSAQGAMPSSELNAANEFGIDPLRPGARPDSVKQAEARLTKSYRERLMALQEQHVELVRRDTELNQANTALMAKLKEISSLEDRLQRELGIGKARKEYRGQRIKSLSALIMTMPPQSGARILANMSEQDAQDIVLGMAQKSERKAAKILAQMPPERAAGLSQRYLAARKHIKGSDGLLHQPSKESKKKEAP